MDMSRRDNVQGILGAISPFWAKWGLGRVPHSQSIFGWYSRRPFGNFVTADFHQIWSRNVIRCPVEKSKDIFKNFHFKRHLRPRSEIESRSNRHLTQSRLQVTGCTAERYCLLHIVVQGSGSSSSSSSSNSRVFV